MQENVDTQTSPVIVSLEKKSSGDKVFLNDPILGLLAGGSSILVLSLLIAQLLPKQNSDLAAHRALYAAALIDTVLCIKLFRSSRTFVIAFAFAALASLMGYLFLLSLAANTSD